MGEHTALLKETCYFDGLDDQQLLKIAGMAKEKTYGRGTRILQESTPSEGVYLITKGRVDISVSLVGSEETESIATIGTGEMVGEMILLGKNRRSANVTAKDSVHVLAWGGTDLISLFEQDARIGYTVMRNVAVHMAERLISANQVLRNALTLPNNNVF